MEYVCVTDHALARFRERVAEYADAGVADVLAALAETVPGCPPEIRNPDPAMMYRTHPRTGAVFVLNCSQLNQAKLITVRLPSVEGRNFSNPKTRVRQVLPVRTVPPSILEEHEPDFDSAEARRDWWVQRKDRLIAEKVGASGRMKRRFKAQIRLAVQMILAMNRKIAEDRMRRHQVAVQELQVAGAFFRSTGELDHAVVVPYLFRKIQELESRLDRG